MHSEKLSKIILKILYNKHYIIFEKVAKRWEKILKKQQKTRGRVIILEEQKRQNEDNECNARKNPQKMFQQIPK